MGPKDMTTSLVLKVHWSKTLRLTIVLLLVWLSATVSVIWFADELNRFEFIGPVGFYMAAQGVLILYVVIIWIYVKRMRQLDLQAAGSEREQ